MVLYLPFSGENFAEELHKLQEALQVHCGKDKHPPIYDPSKFFQFCSLAGAANIDKEFTILLMIDDYHNIHTIRRPRPTKWTTCVPSSSIINH